MQMQRTPELRVYTDGRCAFCWWTRLRALRYDTEHRLDFRDYNDPQIAAETPYDSSELAHQMHVLTPDGRWLGGYSAAIAIMGVLPRFRWVAHVGALPPLRWFGPLLYKFFASNRYTIARWLLRSFKIPEPCAAACDLPKKPSQNSTGIM